MTVKNGAQEPYPVWHFKNIKERGVWGEVVRASVPLGESLALYPGRCPKRCQCFSCVESMAVQRPTPPSPHKWRMLTTNMSLSDSDRLRWYSTFAKRAFWRRQGGERRRRKGKGAGGGGGGGGNEGMGPPLAGAV